MSGAAGGDAGGQPVSLSRAEQKGTVVIYSPYINKLKTIQEVRTSDGMRTLRALSLSRPLSLLSTLPRRRRGACHLIGLL